MSADASNQDKPHGIRTVYYPKDDLLILANDLMSDFEVDLFFGCTVTFNSDTRLVADVVIDPATDILLPALTGGDIEQPDGENGKYPSPEISYFPEEDTLWLCNGLPTDLEEVPFAGCSVFFHGESPHVSAVRFIKAKELFFPILAENLPSRE